MTTSIRHIARLAGTSDISAIAVIHAVQDRGFSVPRDYSVIGFDDLPETAYVFPRLTTVAQPIREVGQLAAQRLETLIGDHQAANELAPGAVVRAPFALIERDSTGPARR